jgi:hypothetical protein
VHQLGDSEYKVREEAAEKLVRIGRNAEPALKRGLRDADPEVRRRCEQLLPLAHRGEAQISEFLRDEDGRAGKALPGWKRFAGIVGTGRDARIFFVDMWRAEPDLMEAAGKHERGAGGLFTLRCYEVDMRLSGRLLEVPGAGHGMAIKKNEIGDAQLGALLFVASDQEIMFAMYPALELSPVLRTERRLREPKGSRAQMLRKLCVPVVLGQHGEVCLPETAQADVCRRLAIAMEFGLPEGGVLATRTLQTGGGDPDIRATAAAALAKLDGRAQLGLLEAMLEDGAELKQGPSRKLDAPGPPTFQVRDVALAMLVYATGQKHSEYGFIDSERKEFSLFDWLGYRPVGFTNDTARQRALAKWKEWRRAHPEG